MGKNQFYSLAYDSHKSDEESYEESSDWNELEEKIKEYQEYIHQQTSHLNKEIQSNSSLTKYIIKLFLSILDHAYDLINEITILMKREGLSNIHSKTYDLDQKLNPIYLLMDKFRNTICSEDGIKRLNRQDFLNEVDIYYNMFICTGNVDYLICSLEYGNEEVMNIVDFIFYKNNKVNKRKRYESYLWILKIKEKHHPGFLSQDNWNRLRKICKLNLDMEKYFIEIFDE